MFTDFDGYALNPVTNSVRTFRHNDEKLSLFLTVVSGTPLVYCLWQANADFGGQAEFVTSGTYSEITGAMASTIREIQHNGWKAGK